MNNIEWITAKILLEVAKTKEYQDIVHRKISEDQKLHLISELVQKKLREETGLRTKIENNKLTKI